MSTGDSPEDARERAAIAEMVARTAATNSQERQQQAAAAHAPTVDPVDPAAPSAAGPSAPPPAPATTVPAPVVADPSASSQPAIQAAKDGSKNDNVEGTGVHESHIARELGLDVRSRDEHEAIQEQKDIPTRPQDVSTGAPVKQHDVADQEALDPDTVNTWAHPDEIPKEVVEGIENDELWKIIRRFDKQMYHVKAIPGQKRGPYPEKEMDLVNAVDEEFSPDRLRSNIERLYINFIVGSAAFFKHMARLRAWTEFNRTASWCAVRIYLDAMHSYFQAKLQLSSMLGLLCCMGFGSGWSIHRRPHDPPNGLSTFTSFPLPTCSSIHDQRNFRWSTETKSRR